MQSQQQHSEHKSRHNNNDNNEDRDNNNKKRRRTHLNIDTDAINDSFDTRTANKNRRRSAASHLCTGTAILLICVLLTVWGDIVDVLSFAHKARLEAALRGISSEGSGAAASGQKGVVAKHQQQFDDNVNVRVWNGNDDPKNIVDVGSGSGSRTVEQPQTGRGRGDYCTCKSECYDSTDGSWCYLSSSSCKLVQPCVKLEPSDYCITTGPGGPITRCINIFNPSEMGQARSPVDHFNLQQLGSSGLVPKAKALAKQKNSSSSSGREHAIMQKVFLEESMAEEIGQNGPQSKRQKLWGKTVRGQQQQKDAKNGRVPTLPDHLSHLAVSNNNNNYSSSDLLKPVNMRSRSKRKAVRDSTGKIVYVDADKVHAHPTGVVQIKNADENEVDEDKQNNDDDFKFPWQDEHLVPDHNNAHDPSESDEGKSDPDDDERWQQLWVQQPHGDNIVESSQHNDDGIYKVCLRCAATRSWWACCFDRIEPGSSIRS